MDLIYKDSYTKVDVKTNTYYFNHTSGEPCEERLSAFKFERSDFYVHRASPAWSIRCSRLKAWFLAYGNKEIYRLECVVFHARDSCKFFYACKRFNMMPPLEANPLNLFVLTSNLYETNKKIECLATGVVIAKGKHNMSIIEGTYDKVKVVVKKVRIMDDSKGTELKKKLRDACVHENLVAFLGCESDNEYNYYAYEGRITVANHIRRHPYVEMDELSMKIITDLVQGVKHLHDQGLVHTNLNPWNIFVKGSTTVKICEGNPTTAFQTDIEAIIYDVVDLKSVLSNGRPSWGEFKNNLGEFKNKDLKVKIIRCDNGGEFKNKEMIDFYTKKGIRKKFSNARTPQQNGVAERRNRTLIEAARTMLADAKLLVTFWAEAVNTACYVQNKVLVNKSQNKTPYELFNSITPAIGFLKPFECHVMILNTLDHLEKFDAKGDEGYFVGYSLSSKAFRVFNKRTVKVEENQHVDFLENKLIENGAGPNWLFNINTLTNSMNYVPVVVAGKSSTNTSGTKDVASQDVKKDVSSLRYFALSNWFHDAHMETRNSNAPDGCNADDPKSSRISNPTATSKVSSTDQVDPTVSLTMAYKIPTVSSPVPIICLDISPESSSGPRLITKGDFSQKETPSLGNALTLSNRFEDTFEVEADLSNMETSIPISPTPTFRIHKDHPKSQMISLVDTAEEPKKIFDALKDPSWIEAMQEELL
nr:putative ribonuclease H-like domain-containing protein [Tanacetum cinerariifolium]